MKYTRYLFGLAMLLGLTFLFPQKRRAQIAEEEKSNKMLKRKTGANLVGLKKWLEFISCQFRDLLSSERR